MKPRAKIFASALWAFLILFAAIIGHAQAPEAADNPDQKEIYAYVLTMDKLHKLEQVRTALSGLLTERTANALDHDVSLTEGTFAQRAKILEVRYPEVTRIVLKQGMLTREYLLAAHVIFRAYILVEAKRHGEIQQYPNSKGGVNPANIAFVEWHLDEVRKSMRDIRLKM